MTAVATTATEPGLPGRDRAPEPGADPNAYRAWVTFDADPDALDRIREQLASWLRPRGLEVDLTQPGLHLAEGRELTVVHHESAGGRDFRARLAERNASGLWTTELTTHVPVRGSSWLALNVTNDRGRPADVPRLAGFLLDVLETRDGELALSSTAPVLGADRVEELLDALCDPDRYGLVFVAGTSEDLPFGPFVDKVRYWTRNIRGLAQAVVLDPHATAAFADLVGSAHAVPPWTLRTFHPVVDPAWEPDARRHRVLGSRRLGEHPDPAIRGMLSRIARGHASARTVPPGATRVLRDLKRIEDQVLVDALFRTRPGPSGRGGDANVPAAPARTGPTRRPAPVPSEEPAPVPGGVPDAVGETVEPATPTTARSGELLVSGEAAQYLAQVELVKELLGLERVDAASLTEIATLAGRARHTADALDRITRELAARQERIAALEDEVAFHKELYAEEEFYRVVAEDERGHAEDEARWLRQQLHAAGRHTVAVEQVPSESVTRHPGSFEELLDRLGELEQRQVVFTGDRSVVASLDDVDGNGKLVRAAWESLLVLADYVTARAAGDHDQGVHQFLERTPSGYRTMSVKKHAYKESAATMKQWGGERMLPVPAEVDASGRACMEPHFKLGRVGMVSPRMHYLDDWARSGRVYVGYVGPHLTTTATN